MRFFVTLMFLVMAVSGLFCQQPPVQAAAPQNFCERIGKTVEHPEALADACHFVLSLRQRLPNVICDQTTTRYISSPFYPGRHVRDVVTAHVIYEDGRERYSDMKVNGKSGPQREMQGQFTYGEFGTDLIFAFLEQNHAVYRFRHKDSRGHHHVFVYESKIRRKDNHGWVLSTNNRTTYPEFDAEISVDQTSHDIVEFHLRATPERDFPVSDVQMRTEYEDLPLGDGTHFVLPTESKSSSCLWNEGRYIMTSCNENVLEFKNCHKFGASSRIVTDGMTEAH